jgi:hypothetical protein
MLESNALGRLHFNTQRLAHVSAVGQLDVHIVAASISAHEPQRGSADQRSLGPQAVDVVLARQKGYALPGDREARQPSALRHFDAVALDAHFRVSVDPEIEAEAACRMRRSVSRASR